MKAFKDTSLPVGKRQLAFLDDLVSFYNKDNRNFRSTNKYNVDFAGKISCSTTNLCRYSPFEGKKNGCAIGRHLRPSVARFFDEIDLGYIFDINTDIGLFLEHKHVEIPAGIAKKQLLSDYLPKWMQDFDIDFLQKCQNLHDECENWDEKGLSELGEMQYDQIRNTFRNSF